MTGHQRSPCENVSFPGEEKGHPVGKRGRFRRAGGLRSSRREPSAWKENVPYMRHLALSSEYQEGGGGTLSRKGVYEGGEGTDYRDQPKWPQKRPSSVKKKKYSARKGGPAELANAMEIVHFKGVEKLGSMETGKLPISPSLKKPQKTDYYYNIYIWEEEEGSILVYVGGLCQGTLFHPALKYYPGGLFLGKERTFGVREYAPIQGRLLSAGNLLLERIPVGEVTSISLLTNCLGDFAGRNLRRREGNEKTFPVGAENYLRGSYLQGGRKKILFEFEGGRSYSRKNNGRSGPRQMRPRRKGRVHSFFFPKKENCIPVSGGTNKEKN